MRIPTLDAWDQFVWLPGTAMPRATTEVEQYGFHRSHTVDLSPVMPATQFRVTDEEGTYLCAAWALVFQGSVLAYNPARDEVEWVPARGITNDLSWAEERSAVALVNYVPHVLPRGGPHCRARGLPPHELAQQFLLGGRRRWAGGGGRRWAGGGRGRGGGPHRHGRTGESEPQAVIQRCRARARGDGARG